MGWIKDIWGIVEDVFTDGDDDDDDGDKGSFGWSDAFDLAKGAAPSLIAGGLGYFGQDQANVANAQQAATQMAFQERMSSTAYQRATGDMAKAGLNPMLAYQQGGASSPAGQSAKLESATSTGVASAIQAAQATAAIKNLQAQTEKANAETGYVRSNTGLNELQGSLIEAQIPHTQASAKEIQARINNLEEERYILRQRFRHLQADANVASATQRDRELLVNAERRLREIDATLHSLQVTEAKAHERFYKETGTLSDYVKLGSEGIGAVSSAAGIFRRRPRVRLGKQSSEHGGVKTETYDYSK